MKSDCTMILDFGSLKLMIFTNIVNDNDRLVGVKCLWPRKRTNNIINNKSCLSQTTIYISITINISNY